MQRDCSTRRVGAACSQKNAPATEARELRRLSRQREFRLLLSVPDHTMHTSFSIEQQTERQRLKVSSVPPSYAVAAQRANALSFSSPRGRSCALGTEALGSGATGRVGEEGRGWRVLRRRGKSERLLNFIYQKTSSRFELCRKLFT